MECSVNFSFAHKKGGSKIRANASLKQGMEPVNHKIDSGISGTVSKIVSVGFKPPAQAFSSLPPKTFGSRPDDSSVQNAYFVDTAVTDTFAGSVEGVGSVPRPLRSKEDAFLGSISLRSMRVGQVYADSEGLTSDSDIKYYINDVLVATQEPDNDNFFLYANIKIGDILRIESDGSFTINALSLVPLETVEFKTSIGLRFLESIYVGKKKSAAKFGGEYFDTKRAVLLNDAGVTTETTEEYRIAAFGTSSDATEDYEFGFGPNPKIVNSTRTSELLPLYNTPPKAMMSLETAKGFEYAYSISDYTSDIRSFATFAETSIAAHIRIGGADTFLLADKLGGHTSNFSSYERGFPATQVFYPVADIESSGLINKEYSSSGLYRSVDEGTFVKTYNGLITVSDEYGSFIQPDSEYAEGNFRYKYSVNAPVVTPRENFLVIRAAAPLRNEDSEISADYKIHNIRFEDPSGNLIVKYKDIEFRGDSKYEYENELYNFTTYITEPEVNYVKHRTWHPDFPILGEPSGYTVGFDVSVDTIHKPFSKEFNKGYQNEFDDEKAVLNKKGNDHLAVYGQPLSTMTSRRVQPAKSFRISNIDLLASGTLFGFLTENRLLLNMEYPPKGDLLIRDIFPSQFVGHDFDTGIYPQTESVWKSSADELSNIYYNTDKYNLDKLANRLDNMSSIGDYVELVSSTGVDVDGNVIHDSGKLTLLYEHKNPNNVRKKTGGSLAIGGDSVNSPFQTAKVDDVIINDTYFDIYDIELHVRARKAVGSRNYTLDVVGYADDKVTIKTPAVGGFLQNASGTTTGSIPQFSGFYSVQETLSNYSISERDSFFAHNDTNNAGGDHYLISDSLLKVTKDSEGKEVRTESTIDSTEFQDYVIPLKIYDDTVQQGKSPNYAVSKYLEALYLDIFPLPSGAAIAKANLVVRYNPANTMSLHVLGTGPKELTRSNIRLHPSARKSNDERFNATWTDHPLSLLEDLPHGYKAPNKEPTLKTNYSRRWRGVDGNVQIGAFDPSQFDFSFEFNQVYQPFLDGHYNFTNTSNNTVLSNLTVDTDVSGVFNSNLSASTTNNRGLRFNSEHLFASQPRSYKTIDWVTDTNDPLYGHILDAYENAVRVSGSDGCFNFDNQPMASGFNVFCRFSPDVTISGSDYNLFNSGVVFSKWDDGSELEFALGFEDGKLCGYAQDSDLNLIKVKDTISYYDYQYPLSVMLSYNDNDSNKLRLYTDSEIASGDFNILRASSSPFAMHSGNSNFVVGHSYGSGVGINAFITEIGISNSGNITVDSYEKDNLQTTAERFFAGHRSKFWNNDESYTHDRYKMWDFVDEDTSKWYLGAFKYCEFNSAFDTMKTRIGEDFIVHEFKNDGTSYEDITDLTIPASLNTSGIAYHTQVENDMLRFNVAGLWDQFYAIPPRISKAYPRSYSIQDDAFAVQTVIQHRIQEDIEWPDGNIGPKLIVSLYTKSKESVHFESTNWGLINRSIHYLAPDMCWMKLNSTFTLKDLKDKTSEPWSNFVQEQNVTEMNHKYFSNDVQDLYVQYDLVYPTGNYDSYIKIHSVDVELKQSITEAVNIDTKFPLMASGDTVVREQLSLAQADSLGLAESHYAAEPPFKLVSLARDPTYGSGDLSLMTSGAFVAESDPYLPLFGVSSQSVSSNNSETGEFSQYPKFGASSVDADEYGKYVVLALDFDGDLDNISPFNLNDSSADNLEHRSLGILPNTSNAPLPTTSTDYYKFGTGSLKQNFNQVRGAFFNDGSNSLEKNTTLSNTLTTESLGDEWNIDFWVYIPSWPPEASNGSNSFKSKIWNANKKVPLEVGALSQNKELIFSLDLYGDYSESSAQWEYSIKLLRGMKTRFFGDVNNRDSWHLNDLQTLSSEKLTPNSWHYISIGSFKHLTVNAWSDSQLRAASTHSDPRSYYNNLYGRTDYNISFIAVDGVIVDTDADIGFQSIEDIQDVLKDSYGHPALILANDWYTDTYDNTHLSSAQESLVRYYLDDMRITIGSARLEVTNNNQVILDNVPSFTMPDPSLTTTSTTTTTTPPPEGLKLIMHGMSEKYRYGDITLHLRNTELGQVVSGVLPFSMLPATQTINSMGIYEGSPSNFTLFNYGSINEPRTEASNNFTLYVVTPPIQSSVSGNFPLSVTGGFNTKVYATGNMPLNTYNFSSIAEGLGSESFAFNGENAGQPIDVADNSLLTLDPDDEIRGITTICFGNCDSNGTCNELELITHDTVWREAGCVDGGIFRPFTTFTDTTAVAFNGDQSGGYVSNYYGVRKYTGLIPAATYDVIVVGKTGADTIEDVPREIKYWEYGTNEDVDYTPLKIVDETTRQAGDKFGKSVSVVGDLMAVGAPGYDLLDSTGFNCIDAGEVFVYRRKPAPSGFDWTDQDDKSGWEVETTLSLAPQFRRDYSTNVPWELKDVQGEVIANFNARQWHVGQEGREFGHSTSIAKMSDREVIAIGGPRSKFTRTFSPIVTRPVNLCVFIFTDEFLPKLPEGCIDGYWRNPCRGPEEIERFMKGKDILYKYFADPAVEFNTKVIIFEPVLGPDIVITEQNFSQDVIDNTGGIAKKYRIHRHTSQYVDSNGQVRFDGMDTTTDRYKEIDQLIFDEIKAAFDEELPYDASLPHNNIPIVLGASVDNSWSMGGMSALGTAFTRFVDFYEDYSFASGVTSFATGSPAKGYSQLFELDGNETITFEENEFDDLPSQYTAEDWLGKSLYVLGSMIDFTNISVNNYGDLISAQIGVYNSAAAEFNFVPSSGGAVYLYEKLNTSTDWNLIQVIDSPTAGDAEYPDGFGHTVEFSKDGSTLAIGSPYSQQNVSVYNRPIRLIEEGEYDINLSFAAWLYTSSAPEVINLKHTYEERARIVGNSQAAKEVYDAVSDSGRFQFIKDKNISPYVNFYNLHQTETMTSNGWSWFAETFMPTSRLGYSISLNDDGSTLAIGAPTDSMGQHDRQSAWYQPKRDRATDWKGYVNAGAVRVLDARKYYPHDGVQEWGRFGNLHETLEMNDSNQSLFPESFLSATYNSIGRPYIRTDADGTEILDDTGLLFIITPEVDALSDQTLLRLREWLAKGDRHLVLVGDDPLWERDGVYSNSNAVINNILLQLDSRMRLHPARNEYESLAYNTVGELHYNVVPSMKPQNSLDSYINNDIQIRGSGVADIRYYNPNANHGYQCEKPPTDILTGIAAADKIRKKTYTEINDKCEMQIVHEGDLRAQWIDECEMFIPTGDRAMTSYYVNLAMIYGKNSNQFYDYRCAEFESERGYKEPAPLLVAAQFESKTTFIPEVPDRIEYRSVTTGFEVIPNSSIFIEAELSGVMLAGGISTLERPTVMWSDRTDMTNNFVFKDLNSTGSAGQSLWFDPPEFRERNAILQCNSDVRNRTDTFPNRIGPAEFAALESKTYEKPDGSSATSEIVLVANTLTETQAVLNNSPQDVNILFYHNLVAMNNDEGGAGKKGRIRIAQLGGWTGRRSFVEGFDRSFLGTLYRDISRNSVFDIGVVENVSMDDLVDSSKGYNVAWIANTNNELAGDDLEKLNTWLAKGDHRLIITYGPEQYPPSLTDAPARLHSSDFIDRLDNVTDMLSKIGVTMKPMYLPNRDRYVTLSDYNDEAASNEGLNDLAANNQTFITGLDPRHDFLIFYNYPLRSPSIELNNATTLLSGNDELLSDSFYTTSAVNVYDDKFVDLGFADFNTGIARARFNLPSDLSRDEHRCHRFFVDISRETLNENQGFYIGFRNALARRRVPPYDFDSHVTNWGSVDEFYKNNPPPINLNRIKELITIDKLGQLSQLSPGGPDVDPEGLPVRGSVFNFNTLMSEFRKMGTGSVYHLEFDALVASDADYVEIYAWQDSDAPLPTDAPEKEKTVRFVSVSGYQSVPDVVLGETYQPITELQPFTVPGRPAQTLVYNYSGPITTDSAKYCPSDFCLETYGQPGPEIADGPVVVAQEIYHAGGFDAGMEKSRITLISDASLIQGPSILDKNGSSIIEGLYNFLTSLYPMSPDLSEFRDADFVYDNIYKIVNPEPLSPAKLINAYPSNSGYNMRFGGFTSNSLSNDVFQPFDAFGDSYLNDLDPERNIKNLTNYWDVLEPVDSFGPFKERRVPPVVDNYEIRKQQERQGQRDLFSSYLAYYASASKFSGIIDGTTYVDASIYGGVPKIMEDTGYDYLDFDRFPSGYPGDLFGYDVKVHKGDIYISAPFAAFNGTGIVAWETVIAETPQGAIYNTQLGHNGGAGVVYIFEKQIVNDQHVPAFAKNFYKSKQWQVKQKIKPDEINAGTQITDASTATTEMGDHTYTDNYLTNNTIHGDMFGHKIAVDADVLAISAPGHDFENVIEDVKGEFVRKEFNEQFDIGNRTVHDLGTASARSTYPGSGSVVLNNGAIFTFENRISNWGKKEQEWSRIHKVVPVGSGSRSQNHHENDFFGTSLSITRARRSDADYTLVAGSPLHEYPTSGSVDQTPLNDAGAIHVNDGMLRRLRPSYAHPETNLEGRIFGSMNALEPYAYFSFKNDGKYDEEHLFSRVVTASEEGEIFIEASGQDGIPKGYVVHRPYLVSMGGVYRHGTEVKNYQRLFTEGRPEVSDGNVPLAMMGQPSSKVYNGVVMNITSAYTAEGSGLPFATSGALVDGTVNSNMGSPSGLMFFLDSAMSASGDMNLFVKGKF